MCKKRTHTILELTSGGRHDGGHDVGVPMVTEAAWDLQAVLMAGSRGLVLVGEGGKALRSR